VLDSHVIPFGGTAARNLRVLDGIAAWCGGLHGSMPLADALHALSDGLGAAAAALGRHHMRTEAEPRLVAVYSGRLQRPLRRGHAFDVFGYLFGRERAGSIVFLSELLDDPIWQSTPELETWRSASAVGDVAAISLVGNRSVTDYIEFHFEKPLTRTERKELESLTATIIRSWHGRKPGLVTKHFVDDRVAQVRETANRNSRLFDEPILGISNPARLSRAEFRVCLMLSRGLSVKGVAETLGLSENTVRSHLRAIYSKTDASSLAELMYLILSVGSPVDDAEYHYGTQ